MSSGHEPNDWLETVLRTWNATASSYRETSTVPDLFEEQADRTPDAVALRDGRDALTYRELDARANAVAHLLRERGVQANDAVALMLSRTGDCVIVVLGILKAGAVYMPLEPSFPLERLTYMMETAGARILLVEREYAEQAPPGAESIVMDEVRARCTTDPRDRLPREATTANDRAYVLYTSGSTGRPKGVEVTHRAINRLVCDVDYVDLGPSETVLHAAPLGFDLSTFEIWGPLLTGGCCVVYPERVPTAEGLARVIRAHGVTTIWLTGGLFNAVIDDDPLALRGVRQVLAGGEALSVPHVRRAIAALPDTQFINGYGPTEATTFATAHRIPASLPADATSVPIGRPIRDTRCYVLDEHRQPVPVGTVGELYIAGPGVALGYVGRPDLTAERFLPDPFHTEGSERMYRSGDLCRWLPDGTLDYMGRTDTQIKISGYRIETGEIEVALLAHAAVRTATVAARTIEGGTVPSLVAWLVLREGAEAPTPRALRRFLAASLPSYMVPSAFVVVPAIPLTTNGKVDRRALPEPTLADRDADGTHCAPRDETERALAETWCTLLGLPDVGVFDNVFDLGANSLMVLRAITRLRKEHGLDVPAVRFFEHPTIAGLAASLRDASAATHATQQRPTRRRRQRTEGEGSEPVAIIGMAARFPGADDVEAFWRNIRAGIESIERFTDEELDPLVPLAMRTDPQYVRARGVLRDADRFDAAFFGMTPREAQLMDPQQRVFLELAWAALEHAGYAPHGDDAPSVGVFAGVNNNTYASKVLARRPELLEEYGEFNAMLLNEKDYVATRAAHKLGLTGPALSIHTACSTSLVAVCAAVQSLRDGQCDVALAGAVSLTVPTRSGYLYQEGGMLSRDGSTRPFDAGSSGTVFNDGAGAVVLKRLADAVHDGDTIHAVVRGVGVNNDGSRKASFTAPSVDGQVAVITMAQDDAGVTPRSISYVEAHGTSTPMGDPIEFEALRRVFASDTTDRGFCGLGSVKSNIGHAVTAAGAAGIIKTALALSHEELPPSLHFGTPNPALDLHASPFAVTAQLTPWPRGDAPRRAGVSSFGVGGTNAHVVVEEAPAPAPREAPSRPEQLLVLSARSPEALDLATDALVAHLRAHPAQALSDVAFTLQRGRRPFAHRRTVVATTGPQAADALAARDAARVTTGAAAAAPPAVDFLFPGQGAQYPGMGSALYAREPVFREAMDRCAEAALPVLGFDLRTRLFVDSLGAQGDDLLRQTELTQPALYATEYALAMLLRSWGIVPRSMIGHSVGEFVCAAIAGVFSPEDGARLVAARGQLMQALPPGSMLSVRLPASEILPRLAADVALAGENGPSLCVVAGPSGAITALRLKLEAESVVCRELHTSHAFHSSMMDPVIGPFEELVRAVPLQAPAVPFVSSVTGDWITPEQACDPAYWSRHLRETVRFAPGVRTLLAKGGGTLVEVGPRATLLTLARQQMPIGARGQGVACLGAAADAATESTALVGALGALWTAGVAPDWRAVHGGERRGRVPLPTYPFERKRHWVDAAPSSPTAPTTSSLSEITDMSSATPSPNSNRRRERLIEELKQLFEQTSGLEFRDASPSAHLLELGVDSLLVTQLATRLKQTYGVPVTFRQIMEELPTLAAIAEHLDRSLPPDAAPAAPAAAPAASAPVAGAPAAATVPMIPPMPMMSMMTPGMAMPAVASGAPAAVTQQLLQLQMAQLVLMQQQLALVAGVPAEVPAIVTPNGVAANGAGHNGASSNGSHMNGASSNGAHVNGAHANGASSNGASSNGASSNGAEPASADGATGQMKYDPTKAFGAIARIHKQSDALTPKQQARLDQLTARYCAKTARSKAHTQQHRAHHADPRVVSGFKPRIKELVYPIVTERASGCRLWDLDGNVYIDALNGFGSNFFGYAPPFLAKALHERIDSGCDIGPQTPLAGEAAALVCELTGMDRAAFCNTGSEAVMGAMRIARTVTGRSLVVAFSGSYHGIFDEVIVRDTKTMRSIPAAPGILPEAVQNILVLEYGTEQTLAVLRERAGELAAVLVETVQSRRPDFQPKAFLEQVRRITRESGTALIFDEVITGFRVHPGGAQAYFGIEADLATYGKVVGAGMPVGVVAGRNPWMDALDGGHWQYGDASIPTAGVTYFAGTFVRHPLTMTAVREALRHMKAEGPALQQRVSDATTRMAVELNAFFRSVGAPIEIRHFASLWKTFFLEPQPYGELLFCYLRDRGVHIGDGFPCFLTTAHGEAEIAFIVDAFKDAVREMQASDFLPGGAREGAGSQDASAPPVPGARLGRDAHGAPAWFVPNPDAPGKYLQLA